VFPGATLTATATIEAIREDNGSHIIDLSVSTKDDEGVEVIKGQASARVDA
jgi:acyl dehydratase